MIFTKALLKKYTLNSKGVLWALEQLPLTVVNDETLYWDKYELCLKLKPTDSKDGYDISYSAQKVTLTASSIVAMINAVQELKKQTIGTSVSKTIAFKTRFYKHEILFKTPEKITQLVRTEITSYTDEFIESFIQYIVSRGFNALVLYAKYHPFEHFLDYKGFKHGTYKDAKLRSLNFNALSKLLQVAKDYGLRTYLHHYVTHFSQALSDHLKLGMDESKGRLANFEHPEIERYNKYVYTRTLETLPQLEGFFLNFESSQNAIDFTRNTLFKVASTMKKKPSLYIRLWCMNDVEGLTALLKEYKGHKGLVHKGHDTNDVIYHPVADDRVKIWKKAMPDVEFTFSIGPCHNCSTNIRDRLWTDPQYIHDLLTSMQSKGADSISFQSVSDISFNFIAGSKNINNPQQLLMSRMNQGHIDAFLDYVNGVDPSTVKWNARYQQYFNTSSKAAAEIKKAVFASSKIIVLQFQQFCFGSSQEGYLYDGRFSFYQEPFFYYPMSFKNRIGELHVNYSWKSWVVRDTKIKIAPNDTQAIIDYVNPNITKEYARNPDVIIKEIKKYVRASKKALEAYAKIEGPNADKLFMHEVFINYNYGERIWREIEIAKNLYSCYFATSSKSFFKHLKKARDFMLESVEEVDIKATIVVCSVSKRTLYPPGKDAKDLDAIIAYEGEDIPFEALKHYALSHVHYNEIRRLCRAYISIEDEMKKINLRLLHRALKEVELSLKALEDPAYALYRDNVNAWRDYLRYEVDALTPPAMTCLPAEKAKANTGFRKMYHDQNYRWGDFCWKDFSSFFRRQNFFCDDVLDCRVTYSKKGLVVTLREHNINWKDREATWEQHTGSVNQRGFMHIILDPTDNKDERQQYTLYFKAEKGEKTKEVFLSTGKGQGGKPSVFTGYDSNFSHTDSSWECSVTIPWKEIGTQPKNNDVWRFNIFSNPSVTVNRRFIWAQGFESKGDHERLGRIVFTENP